MNWFGVKPPPEPLPAVPLLLLVLVLVFWLLFVGLLLNTGLLLITILTPATVVVICDPPLEVEEIEAVERLGEAVIVLLEVRVEADELTVPVRVDCADCEPVATVLETVDSVDCDPVAELKRVC